MDDVALNLGADDPVLAQVTFQILRGQAAEHPQHNKRWALSLQRLRHSHYPPLLRVFVPARH